MVLYCTVIIEVSRDNLGYTATNGFQRPIVISGSTLKGLNHLAKWIIMSDLAVVLSKVHSVPAPNAVAASDDFQ